MLSIYANYRRCNICLNWNVKRRIIFNFIFVLFYQRVWQSFTDFRTASVVLRQLSWSASRRCSCTSTHSSDTSSSPSTRTCRSACWTTSTTSSPSSTSASTSWRTWWPTTGCGCSARSASAPSPPRTRSTGASGRSPGAGGEQMEGTTFFFFFFGGGIEVT